MTRFPYHHPIPCFRNCTRILTEVMEGVCVRFLCRCCCCRCQLPLLIAHCVFFFVFYYLTMFFSSFTSFRTTKVLYLLIDKRTLRKEIDFQVLIAWPVRVLWYEREAITATTMYRLPQYRKLPVHKLL